MGSDVPTNVADRAALAASGARWTFCAMCVATPISMLADTATRRTLLWMCATVAGSAFVAYRKNASSAWWVGALALTPLAWIDAERSVNPAVMWGAYEWWTAFCAWSAALLGLFVCHHFFYLGALATQGRRDALALIWRPVAHALLIVSVVGGLLSAIAGPASGHREWDEFVRRVTAEGALEAERRAVVTDASRSIEIPAPSLIRHAYVANVASWPAERHVLRSPGGVVPEGELVRHRRSCLVADDGAVVLVDAPGGWGLIPLHDPAFPRGRALIDFGTVRLSAAGFVAPLGAPPEVAWALGVAACAGVTMLLRARSWRRRARRLARLHEIPLLRGLDGLATSARLASGELVRLAGATGLGSTSVLIAPPSPFTESAEGYRDDSRRETSEWVAVEGSREAMTCGLLARAERIEAIVVVAAAWLSIPAMVAWSHAFVVSPW